MITQKYVILLMRFCAPTILAAQPQSELGHELPLYRMYEDHSESSKNWFISLKKRMYSIMCIIIFKNYLFTFILYKIYFFSIKFGQDIQLLMTHSKGY